MRNSNTKKLKRISEKTLLVTVDMGKVKHTGYYRFPDGTEGKTFEFFNSRKGFEEFWWRICQAKRSLNLTDVVIGFESTGPYAEPLLHFLRKRNVRLVQVNPLHTKRLKELQGNSPNKTDKKDPKIIADIIELGHALTVIIPEGTVAELRRLTQARERSIQRMGILLNQLRDLVFLIFPEFMPVMKDITLKSTQYLLKNYPRPQDIGKEGAESLTQILKKVSRGRLGRERAEALYHAAMDSVGIIEGHDSIVLEIKEIISTIEGIERFVSEIESLMSKHLKEVPYSRFILSIKGIGEITAAGLIGEMGDFKKYRTVSEVIKHAGLDLFEISSGKHKGKRRISKRGRPLLRKLLFFASINVVRKGGILHKQYQHHLKKGMPKIKALVAISRKLLSIIFALVRDHSVYIARYTKTQQLKEAA
ncbi:MAG TPA: IS110 family transposase [Thermodesulfovibrionales bacterium]|nr:IS110 family transposase [Thermodesulfovibrionales bacterium]